MHSNLKNTFASFRCLPNYIYIGRFRQVSYISKKKRCMFADEEEKMFVYFCCCFFLGVFFFLLQISNFNFVIVEISIISINSPTVV